MLDKITNFGNGHHGINASLINTLTINHHHAGECAILPLPLIRTNWLALNPTRVTYRLTRFRQHRNRLIPAFTSTVYSELRFWGW